MPRGDPSCKPDFTNQLQNAKTKNLQIYYSTIQSCDSYDIRQYNENINKNIIKKCDYAKRNTKVVMYKRAKMIAKNQNEIMDRSVSIISDNIINELLYLLKVYHLQTTTLTAICISCRMK